MKYIFAVIRETTGAEDHVMRTDLTNLYYTLLVYKEKYISLLCERYMFSHINRV